MRFTYRPSVHEAYLGLRHGFWGTPRSAALSLLAGGVVGLPVLLAAGDLPPYWRIGLAISAALLWSLAFTFGFARLMAPIVTRRMLAGGEVVIDVTDEFLERRQGSSTLRVHWAGISQVTDAPHAYLFREGNRIVFSIEKSAATSAAERQALRQLILAKLPESRLGNDDF